VNIRTSHREGVSLRNIPRSSASDGAIVSGHDFLAAPTCGTASRIVENELRPRPISQHVNPHSRLGVFFVLSLAGRICSSNNRARFDQAKLPLAKKPSTLPGSQVQAILPFDMRCQGLPVPKISLQTEIRWPFAQRLLQVQHLLRTQPARTSRALPFLQPCQSLLLKPAHPIFNGPRSITQQLGDLTAIHTLSNKQDAVQTVVIAGFGVSSDFILQTQYYHRSIRNRQWFHIYMKPHFHDIRNYL